MQRLLDGSGVAHVAVGFSPPAAVRALADHLGLRGAALSDERRVLYRLLGLRRAPVWRVYSPGTVLHYARAVLRGQRVRRPVEDVRQLGGDAVAVDGVVVRVWRPRSPDDRVDPGELAALARECAAGSWAG